MLFEVGKFYKHTSGEAIHIIAKIDTLTYGNCLVAEPAYQNGLLAIGTDEESTVNYTEITESEFKKIAFDED